MVGGNRGEKVAPTKQVTFSQGHSHTEAPSPFLLPLKAFHRLIQPEATAKEPYWWAAIEGTEQEKEGAERTWRDSGRYSAHGHDPVMTMSKYYLHKLLQDTLTHSILQKKRFRHLGPQA